MGKIKKIVFKFLKFLQVLAPVLAFIYLAGWFVQFYDETTYDSINSILGGLPSFIEIYFYQEVDLFGKDASMGFVHSSCIMLIIFFLAKYYEKKAYSAVQIENQKAEELEGQKVQIELIKQQNREKKEQITEKLRLSKVDTYFGLFEFKFTFNVMTKAEEDAEKLSKEYSKMMADKMKEKYPNMSFFSVDKIFIVGKDFSIFDEVVVDLIKLYRIIQDINNQKLIKTEMILSFWCDDKYASMKHAMNILTAINSLNFKNKVVGSKKLAQRYGQEFKKEYIFQEISGNFSDVQNENSNFEDSELYYFSKNKNII